MSPKVYLYQVRASLDAIKERAYEKLGVSNPTEFWDKFGNYLVPCLSYDEMDYEERREFSNSATFQVILEYFSIFGFRKDLGIGMVKESRNLKESEMIERTFWN